MKGDMVAINFLKSNCRLKIEFGTTVVATLMQQINALSVAVHATCRATSSFRRGHDHVCPNFSLLKHTLLGTAAVERYSISIDFKFQYCVSG